VCSTPIEFAYYASNNLKVRKDVCAYCAAPGAEKDKDLLENYKIVLPVCTQCKHKPALKRAPFPKMK